MPVRESPEIAAVVTRIGEAWGSRDFETYSNLISRSPHFRAIGTDADEIWESAQSFLAVRRVQSEELDAQGWTQAEGTLESLHAFEDGTVGWASMVYALTTPIGVVNLRATVVLTLESGTWKAVHWHTSVPTPNVHTFGVELSTTLDVLLTAVADDPDALDELGRSEGTLTLVFTDIVDSTALAERVGDTGWVTLVKDHEAAVRRLTSRHGGNVIKMLGDGSMLAFDSARAAVRAALAIQDSSEGDYAVRIGIHAGDVVRRDGDLLGVTVNKAARVASIAQGGQVLVSTLVEELIGATADFRFESRETVTLKGLSGTHSVVAVRAAAGN